MLEIVWRVRLRIIVLLRQIPIHDFSRPLLLGPRFLYLFRVELDKMFIDFSLVHHLQMKVIGSLDLQSFLLQPPNKHQVVIGLVLLFLSRNSLLWLHRRNLQGLNRLYGLPPAFIHQLPIITTISDLFLLNLIRIFSFHKSAGLALGKGLLASASLQILAPDLRPLFDLVIDQTVYALETPFVRLPLIDRQLVLKLLLQILGRFEAELGVVNDLVESGLFHAAVVQNLFWRDVV